MELSRVPRKEPPSKTSAWAAGCGVAFLLAVIASAGLGTITFLAMHSMGACLDGDDTACKRACFGISSDGSACLRHGDAMAARGDRAEAERAYSKGCDEGEQSACSALSALRGGK